MKILTVVGARPQFIKASPLSRVLRQSHTEILVHTGQHYDNGMSDVFFADLDIPLPDHHLGVGSGMHGAQTGAMLAGIEHVMVADTPDVVLVYGDTNSTIAGALAAAKLNIPVAHVEAGLRSFNRQMPEEINRIVTDHLSRWLFAPSEASRRQLESEGITDRVIVVGDIMADALRLHRELAAHRSAVRDGLGLEPGQYYLATLHRAENTDDPHRLKEVFAAFNLLDRPVVIPLHPRTRERLARFELSTGANVVVLEPAGYLDMLNLQLNARAILTDSGGMQKEAYYLGVPCITLRSETEWIETVATGWNTLAGTEPNLIVEATQNLPSPDMARPELYGDGHAAERVARVLEAS